MGVVVFFEYHPSNMELMWVPTYNWYHFVGRWFISLNRAVLVWFSAPFELFVSGSYGSPTSRITAVSK